METEQIEVKEGMFVKVWRYDPYPPGGDPKVANEIWEGRVTAPPADSNGTVEYVGLTGRPQGKDMRWVGFPTDGPTYTQTPYGRPSMNSIFVHMFAVSREEFPDNPPDPSEQ